MDARTLVRRGRRLRPFLDDLHARYHAPAYLGHDPLAYVRRFASPEDREVAAVFAALLAYGNVKQIGASLVRVYDAMGGAPAEFLASYDAVRARRAFRGLRHRVTAPEDLVLLSGILASAARAGGAGSLLASCVAAHPDACDIAEPLAAWTRRLRALPLPAGVSARRLEAPSFRHLLPDPAAGSACKRLMLLLRWLVRADDGIDLGLWRGVPPRLLLVPLDTHVLRISKNLGLTSRAGPTLAAAREVTAALREADPDDPVRYDFALCRLGILQACPTASRLEACAPCELRAVCDHRRTLARRKATAVTS